MRASNRPYRLAAAVCGLVLVGVVAGTSWICDDAYLTLRTADNLVNGYGPTWNVTERVQAYTHPLWMLVLSGAYALTREAYFTTTAVCLLLTAAVAASLARAAEGWGPVLALGLLTLSSAAVDYSTSGLENGLAHALVIPFLIGGSVPRGDGAPTPRRIAIAFLLACLLVLNRLDHALLVAPVLAVDLAAAGPDRRAWLAAVTAWLPLMAWEAFSLVYYGFPFPNTAYAKLSTGVPALEYLRQGLRYLAHAARHDPVTWLAIGGGVVAAWTSGDRRARAAALGVGLYLAYVVRIGGDFMGGRFLSVPAVASAALLARRTVSGRTALLGLVGAAAVAALGSGRTLLLRGDPHGPSSLWEWGIADERRHFRRTNGLREVLSAGADGPVDHPWRLAGEAARSRALAGGETIVVAGTVGMLGYYAGPAVHVLDTVGLAEPFVARLPVPRGQPWRIGHFERELPLGYVASLRHGQNRLQDVELARAYDAVRLAVSGPLWSAGRFRAIVDLNLGRHDGAFAASGRDHGVREVPYAWVSGREVAEGSSWTCDRCVQLLQRGLLVRLAGPSHARATSLGLDGRSGYDVRWLRGNRPLGERRLPMVSGGGEGMRVWSLPTPEGAAEAGFDAVVILPVRQEGTYSLGHLVARESGTPPTVRSRARG